MMIIFCKVVQFLLSEYQRVPASTSPKREDLEAFCRYVVAPAVPVAPSQVSVLSLSGRVASVSGHIKSYGASYGVRYGDNLMSTLYISAFGQLLVRVWRMPF